MALEKWKLYSEPSTYKIKVPGGYLYRHGYNNMCMAFVPDVLSRSVRKYNPTENPPDIWEGYCEKE